MEVIRLKPGEHSPDARDRITVQLSDNGRFRWSGEVGYTHTVVSKSDQEDFPSYEAAEAKAVSWAHYHNVSTLYIEIELAR